MCYVVIINKGKLKPYAMLLKASEFRVIRNAVLMLKEPSGIFCCSRISAVTCLFVSFGTKILFKNIIDLG